MEIDYSNHSELKLIRKRNTWKAVSELFCMEKSQEVLKNQVKENK